MELYYKPKSDQDLEFIYNNMNSFFSMPYYSLDDLLYTYKQSAIKNRPLMQMKNHICWIITSDERDTVNSIEEFYNEFIESNLERLL